MSTRAAIVRTTGESTFEGAYHHWDGYPEALGKTLFELHRGHFRGDLAAMVKFLIDDHPAGWSTINEADFTLVPGFREHGYRDSPHGPKCYCHGDRAETANTVTQDNAANIGCEYVYMFDAKAGTMTVLSSYYETGTKMIGAFGCGDPDALWKPIAVVDLAGDEPDWENIEGEE